ncbi:MAG: CoA ester lyase, partial [Acidimicrobiales bacterium]|nr:CoA ester lyase [Acidimicrobiales bacterium]
CDALILDLEDAVAADAKVLARERAVTAAGSSAYGARIVAIRCNGLDTPWGAQDLVALARAGAGAVVVPKVGGASDVDRYVEALRSSGAPDDLAVWPMVETPRAVVAAGEIAAHPRVEVLVVGTNDLLLELRAVAVAGRAPLVAHLAQVVLHARANGVAVLDGVFNDIGDADGFAAECRQGVELGFDGKTLIHPSQIEPANSAWSPSSAEVAHARRVIETFAAAEAQGQGVATLDGKMIENLHVEIARRVLNADSAEETSR